MRVEAKLDLSATILWIAAFVVAGLLAWWDAVDSRVDSRVDPANPDDLVWIEVEQE